MVALEGIGQGKGVFGKLPDIVVGNGGFICIEKHYARFAAKRCTTPLVRLIAVSCCEHGAAAGRDGQEVRA